MSTCTTCGCEAPVGGVSCENGPVGSVRKGANVRVSDRNGIPKNLDNLDKSVLVSSEDEGVEARDGSHDRPIFLNLDDLVTAGAIVIVSDDGKLGIVKANGNQNQIFGLFNGGIGFKDETAAIPEFESSQLESSSGGRLASFGCSSNGKVRLTSFNPNIQSTKYLTIDENGNVNVSDHDIDGCPSADAVDDGEIDYILGCKNGSLVILPPQEGKILKEENFNQ